MIIYFSESKIPSQRALNEHSKGHLPKKLIFNQGTQFFYLPLFQKEISCLENHLKLARKIFEVLWDEFLNFSSMRNQLSFSYVRWKNNLDIN